MRGNPETSGGWRGIILAAVLLATLPCRGAGTLQPGVGKGDLPAAERADLEREAVRLSLDLARQSRASQFQQAVATARRALAVQQKLYPPERFKDGHPALASCLSNLGVLLLQTGEYGQALPYQEQALAMRQKLFPRERFPDGHPQLALSLDNLGALRKARAEFGMALKYCEQGLAMKQKLYPPERFKDGHPALAFSLNNLGSLYKDMGQYDQALRNYEQALAMREKLYPPERFKDGHPDVANSLNNLGSLLKEMGVYGKALRLTEQALAMRTRLYPPERFKEGHPELATTLNNLGVLLKAMGAYGKALPLFEQALAMRRKLYPPERYPDGHPLLAESLNNLGVLLKAMGENGKAMLFYEQSLAMREKLYSPSRYPDGHPDLAQSLNNLGALLLQTIRDDDQALRCFQRALAMRQRLYPPARHPDGHPLLAISLENLGLLRQRRGEHEKALSLHRQAVEMLTRLYPKARYPDGHPQLAASLQNLGTMLRRQGESGKALPVFEQALAMLRNLYPPERFKDGHLFLASGLTNMGFLRQARGEHAEALRCYEEALRQYHKQLTLHTAGAPEPAAHAFISSLPATRDALLSCSRDRPDYDATAYRQIWDSRAFVFRLLQRRHLAARVAASADKITRARWDELLETRTRISQLMLDSPADLKARDHELQELFGRRDRLERDLDRLLPELVGQRDLEKHTPADLSKRLPAGAVLVDLVNYLDYHKGKEVPARYTAFVLRRGAKVVRVELGEAAPIDRVVTRWRQALLGWAPGLSEGERRDLERQADELGAELRRRVWSPLAKYLPAGTGTVYLVPDGDLARLPWAALPGSKPGTVLLEELALAVMPHAPFVLEDTPKSSGLGKEGRGLVVVGAIDYGTGKTWAPLKGSAAEVKQVAVLAGAEASVLTGAAATPRRVADALKGARYALLSTHAFFDERRLNEERARVVQQVRRWRLEARGPGQELGIGLRLPLVYNGLVLAGANEPRKAEGSSILDGEAIVDLPLEGLRLAVLSACDTGVGVLTEDEGVRGLVRAFHLAGCRDVIASQWKVNDEATAALMARLFHGLLKKGKTPLAALREAQLALYRHPELLPRLAGTDRGPPDFAAAVRVDAGQPLPARTRPEGLPRRTPPRYWAAFFLSGSGR
jgi:CHAT domain-containing protein/tetratricopeptide (TPR) repeat protein